MTTILLSGGDLGCERMMVRCDLRQASAPVQVNYCNDSHKGDGWKATQYQCADTRHTTKGLIAIAERLAAEAVQATEDEFSCDVEEI